MLTVILEILKPIGGFFIKMLPFLAAFKVGGDRVKAKQDKEDAEILKKTNKVKPVRSHSDVRKRVRKLKGK